MVAHRTDTYAAVHRHLSRERGRAITHRCVDCGNRADTWSYSRPDPTDQRHDHRGLPYSLDLTRYDPRCRSCHSKRDGCGNFQPGMRNPRARLTDADVVAIRAARAAGVPRKDVAAQYGVTPEYVSHLVRGTWRGHVPLVSPHASTCNL